jgi:hypothetical protein
VELVAVMALYSPFAERAGMRLIKKTTPDDSVFRAVDEFRKLGFDPSRMGSRSYNREMLEKTTFDDVIDAFRPIHGSIKYRRLHRGSRVISTKKEFRNWLLEQDLDSLAWSIQILSVLAQSKAYLYWCREGEGGGV